MVFVIAGRADEGSVSMYSTHVHAHTHTTINPECWGIPSLLPLLHLTPRALAVWPWTLQALDPLGLWAEVWKSLLRASEKSKKKDLQILKLESFRLSRLQTKIVLSSVRLTIPPIGLDANLFFSPSLKHVQPITLLPLRKVPKWKKDTQISKQQKHLAINETMQKGRICLKCYQ